MTSHCSVEDTEQFFLELLSIVSSEKVKTSGGEVVSAPKYLDSAVSGGLKNRKTSDILGHVSRAKAAPLTPAVIQDSEAELDESRAPTASPPVKESKAVARAKPAVSASATAVTPTQSSSSSSTTKIKSDGLAEATEVRTVVRSGAPLPKQSKAARQPAPTGAAPFRGDSVARNRTRTVRRTVGRRTYAAS
jgi:hypothetical protein